MPPGLGLIVFAGLGYVLVYASVANAGRFATHPWAGLLEDAYTGNRSAAPGIDSAPLTPLEKAIQAGTNAVRPRPMAGGRR